MCYPKPGPRCSAHMSKSLVRAFKKHDKDPTTENHKNLKEAVNGYLETPAGIRGLSIRYGEENPITRSYELKRKQMIEDFKGANPQYDAETAQRKFDKQNSRIQKKANIDLDFMLKRDRFITDSLRNSKVQVNRKGLSYEEACQKYSIDEDHVVKASDSLVEQNDTRTRIMKKGENFVVLSEKTTRIPSVFGENHPDNADAALYDTVVKKQNSDFVFKELQVKYTKGHQRFHGVDDTNTHIIVKGYVEGNSLSDEEVEIRDKMANNVSIIRNLQKQRDRIKKEDTDGSRKPIIKKIDEKIDEGYSSLEILSKNLKTESEFKRSQNFYDSLHDSENMHKEDLKIFHEISNNHFQS